MEMNISLPLDSDGFLSQECPKCRRRFKVVFGEGSKSPISCCPYCGHRGQGCWWTTQQADYIAQAAARPIKDEFARDFKRLNRPGSLLRFSVEAHHGPTPVPPCESDTPMPIMTFACCGERVKFDGPRQSYYCLICGTPASL